MNSIINYKDINLSELNNIDNLDNMTDLSYDSSSSSEYSDNISDSDNIDSCSSYSIDSDSLDYEINSNDLFNSKTNGNEFHGDVLKNQYLIFKKIGYGAFSSVWMGYDIKIENLVAIKIINPQDIKEGLREIKIYKKIKEINNIYLLNIIDYFKIKPKHNKYYKDNNDNNNLYHIVIILPLMGCNAYNLLECEEYSNGLPFILAFKIIEQTLLAIKALEDNNLMHTDLKPENILIYGLNREAEILIKLIKDININIFLEDILSKVILENPNINEDEIWNIKYEYYKKVAAYVINFIKNNMKLVKNQMKNNILSANYLNDIKIKLCDFNLVIEIDKHLNKIVQIQTRYYRAPEIILGTGLDRKTDYWSIPCILFELLTGDILFETKKNKSINKDLKHLCLIEQFVYKIPKNILSKAKYYNNIYNDTNLINIIKNNYKKLELKDIFNNNYENLNLDSCIINDITNYIYKILEIDPSKRPSIDELIELTREFIKKYNDYPI